MVPRFVLEGSDRDAALRRDLLKALPVDGQSRPDEMLAVQVLKPLEQVRGVLLQLQQRGLVTEAGSAWKLTEDGQRSARHLK
ncbi:MAG: hypothetical protein ABIJ46_05015 [bacterium]